ncbi:YhdP family protein [Aquamicrobium ahrensii]|uniref:YhdP family protein n=1 Tax=Aquamicrobium ahrensii TaxID=469551 RepID=UPI0033942BC7
MGQELPQHEKIRFRRSEITDLSALPSAGCAPPLGRAVFRRRFRWLKRAGLGLALLAVVIVAAVYAIGASGLGTDRLRQEAESAIRRLAETDVKVSGGSAGVTLDGSSFLALQIRDLSLTTADGGKMLEAGAVRFGMRALPLVTGEVRLTSARLSDARIDLAAFPSGKGDWVASLRDTQGLIDPDKVLAAVFDSVREVLDAVKMESVRDIRLVNVELALPADIGIRSVKIADAVVRQAGSDRMELSTKAMVDGRAVTLAGVAARDPQTRRIVDLDATVEVAGPRLETFWPGGGHELGAGTLRLTGSEGVGETASKLQASLEAEGAALDFGPRGLLAAEISMQATLESGVNKVDVGRLLVKTGRSNFAFQGSIGPRPPQVSSDERPAYRYDFVSDGSTLAPDDSSEPALRFLSRIAGVYDVESRRLIADTIAVRSGAGGEAVGMATLQFAEDRTPGLFLALNVHDMPVSHVKQLWPWMAAGSARQWVLKNLFGGRVPQASLRYDVQPGRLGSGVPLSAQEVSGRFDVEGARFDTAGHIPPVRDAIGRVEFEGTQVRISLDSGTVYMPSGRIAAASNGTLTVDDANQRPVIGKLDIDVEGDADAIVELASYEPINAMRYVGLKPEEFSGRVTGNVKADIPLHSGIDTSRLNWLVALDYKGLALENEFDGQKVTDADGSIIVDPRKATIIATAKLNDIPAEVSLVEPLKASDVARSRQVTLILDDKLRDRMMPGLSSMLEGTIKVALENRADGARSVATDLTAAKLVLPWVGWSKGAGVPAQAAFTMKTEGGGVTRLSGFSLDGKSFSAEGDVVLSGGVLSSATFGKVRLNRDDDVAVSVRRTGSGYKVDVSGAALDARAIIKQFTADPGGAGKASSKADTVSLTADIGRLTGFHSEMLTGLKLSYNGAGSRIDSLEASATAGEGASVTAKGGTSGAQRNLSMRSADAGAILRFLDIYRNVRGGGISIAMQGSGDGPLRGKIDARDFVVVDEPKLASIVSTAPAGDSRSLNQAVRGNIDTSRVQFERGSTEVEKGVGYVRLANGVLRGPLIGTTFQGILYDQNDNMDMTGTFMPAYGLNRIFGELPLVGAILGNGRDRGLIGVTYRLRGNLRKPELEINPLSVIAPGIFRSIFEYR